MGDKPIDTLEVLVPSIKSVYNEVVHVKNIELIEWLLIAFGAIGIFIKICSFSIPQGISHKYDPITGLPKCEFGSSTGSIWGYSIILFSVLGLIFITIDITETKNNTYSDLPYTLYGFIIILIWNISLNILYSNTINCFNPDDESPNYKTFSNWTFITICILGVLSSFIFMKNKQGDITSKNLSKQINTYGVIVLIAAGIVTGITQTILETQLVDG